MQSEGSTFDPPSPFLLILPWILTLFIATGVYTGAVEEIGDALPAIFGQYANTRAWLVALASFVLCSFIWAYQTELNAGYVGAELTKRTIRRGIRISFIQSAFLLLFFCLIGTPTTL